MTDFLLPLFDPFMETLLFLILLYSLLNLEFKDNYANIAHFFVFTFIGLFSMVLLSNFISMILKTTISIVYMALIISYCLKYKIKDSLFATLLYTVFVSIGNGIFAIWMVKFVNKPIDYIFTNPSLFLLSEFIVYSTVFSLILMTRYIKKLIYSRHQYSFSIGLRATLYIATTSFVIMLSSDLLKNYLVSVDYRIIAVMILIIISYFIFALYINFIDIEATYQKQSIEEQKKYIQMIEQILEGYRELKHGYKNYISSFSGYILADDWEGLKNYYLEIYSSIEEASNDLASVLIKIKNYPVFGLMMEKMRYARTSGVIVQLSIPHDIKFSWASAKTADFCYCLGNMLDNSIEACLKNPSPILELKWFIEDAELNIILKNTYLENSHSEGFDRGHGLEIVYKKFSKYPEIIFNNYFEDDHYVQELVIPIK